jgi:hypothetical protein
MRKVLVFSGLHTGPEHENGFSFFLIRALNIYLKGFQCFPICTQILNSGKVSFVHGGNSSQAGKYQP